ncbi:MAG: DUF4249 domain-containing protein [Chitinophagia bacterium]|nr:DUF4249 domain-containing protein [Chitinophagia bacterium]
MRPSVLIIFSFFFFSCEKDIDLKLDPSENRLVVDANIENGRPPVVFLSKSIDYFSKITPSLLSESFVHHAMVSVSDGSQNVKLIEDTIVDIAGNKIFYYTTPKGSLFLGKISNTYKLNIQLGNDFYTATTTIPEITRRVDSMWWEKLPFSDDPKASRVMITAKDKAGLGDYIRYFTKVNSGPFLPGFTSVYDDDIIDGKTYTIPLEKGFDKNGIFVDSLSYYKRGDTVTFKLCQIDKNTYEFWRTYEFSYQSIGNPFSSPVKIQSNISNNALGCFSGYAAQYRTLIIPKL